jgi:hypothetical protein
MPTLSADEQFVVLRHIVRLLRDAERDHGARWHYLRACDDILEGFALYQTQAQPFVELLSTVAADRQSHRGAVVRVRHGDAPSR